MLMELQVHSDDDSHRRLPDLGRIVPAGAIGELVPGLLADAPDQPGRKLVGGCGPHFHEIPDSMERFNRNRDVEIGVEGPRLGEKLGESVLRKRSIHKLSPLFNAQPYSPYAIKVEYHCVGLLNKGTAGAGSSDCAYFRHFGHIMLQQLFDAVLQRRRR